jgi:hypothetical protein
MPQSVCAAMAFNRPFHKSTVVFNRCVMNATVVGWTINAIIGLNGVIQPTMVFDSARAARGGGILPHTYSTDDGMP